MILLSYQEQLRQKELTELLNTIIDLRIKINKLGGCLVIIIIKILKEVYLAKIMMINVAGFYGRPWTPEQRKSLFQLMHRLGLNTYMYAPKDDCKHRAFWRDLYSVEEAGKMQK